MKNCIHFTIWCFLLDHYVQKSYAYHDHRQIPRGSHTPVSNNRRFNDYNNNHYNGYVHHQEQQQMLGNGYQSQQQMSAQYQYQTEPPVVGSGEVWHENSGPVQIEYQPQIATESSNYVSHDMTTYPYPPVLYVYEQQQMQHSGLLSDNNQYSHYPDIQQQYQNSKVDMNGYAFDRSQYQYQDGSEQMQDQYASAYAVPLHGRQIQGLSTAFGQTVHRTNSELKPKRPDIEETASSQYRQQPETPQIHQPHHLIKSTDYIHTIRNNGSQHPTDNSQHVLLPSAPPAPQKLTDGLWKANPETMNESTRVKAASVATDTGNVCDNRGQLSPLEDTEYSTMTALNRQKHKIECPPDVLGIYPHPFSNTQYIKCFDGRLLIKPCRRGLLFSLSRKLCDINEYLQSFDTSVPIELPQLPSPIDEKEYHRIRSEIKTINETSLECPSGVSGKFAYPFLRTRYVTCANGVTKIETCARGTIYSIRGKMCVPRHKVDSFDYVRGIGNSFKSFANGSTLGVICGPHSDGKYAHPEYLRKFVICRHGIVKVKRCPGVKMFDINFKECI